MTDQATTRVIDEKVIPTVEAPGGGQLATPTGKAPATPLPGMTEQAPARRRFRLPKPPFYLTTFVLFVLLPAIAAQIYLIFLASDQFQATARFAVRSAQESGQGMAAIQAVTQGGGLSQVSIAGQDAHVVVAYIKSRAILDDLQKTIDIRTIYSRPEADFWARLKKDATAEELTDYWLGMVTTNVDGPSGIVTIYVKAFRAQDALDLANAVVKASEALVNDVSTRAKRDAMKRAEEEVARADAMVQKALADLRTFREKVGYIDPVASATMTSTLIAKAMADKIQIENELFVSSKMMSPNAPTLKALASRLEIVNQQIDRLKASLTGSGQSDTPLSNSLVEFEEKELQKTFAVKLYTMSQDALENARLLAEKQNIYISVFVPASLPQEARFPERISLSIIIPITLVVMWGIFALLGAAIEDHRI